MITDFMITDMLPILILFAGFNVLDVIAHVIRGKLNDAPTSIPLRSTHLCIPQLFKAHREGTSEVFWDFLWKEIIGLVVLVGTGVIWGLLAAGVFGTAA